MLGGIRDELIAEIARRRGTRHDANWRIASEACGVGSDTDVVAAT